MKKMMTALAAFTLVAGATACSETADTEAASTEAGSIAGEWKAADFDTILAGFEPADLDALLNPDDDSDDEDHDPDEEHEKSEVTVAVGLYRFRITQDEFVAWSDRVKQDAGFDKDSVIQEIRTRLDL